MLLILVGTMFGLLLMGFPMMIPLIGGAMVTLALFFPNLPDMMLVQQIITGIEPTALIAVPLFIFAADLMSSGQVADRLLNFVIALTGHKRGGLPIATCAACTMFGAVSGSTQATVVAIGGPMRPKMLEAGYSDGFTTGLIIKASEIALLIPPSIAMIVYGVVNGTSVGELFVAGLGPGLLIFLLFSLYCWWYSHAPVIEKATRAERLKATKEALLTFTFPLLIFGGIYSGTFSPTEAAAVAVLYAFILEVFIYKSVSIKAIPSIALKTGAITAIIFILVGMGQAFSWVISFARIPQMILPNILGVDPTVLWILCVISIAYFIGCMFVDPIVVIMIMSPIFSPVVTQAGIDPVLVGIIVTLQAAIGSGTPPFGCNIFTAMAVFKQRYSETISGIWPFVGILILVSGSLIIFPQIALFLRDIAFR